MKKIFLLSILFLTLLSTSVSAQVTVTPQPILTGIPIVGKLPKPGINCGVIDPNNQINKCCYYQPVNTVSIKLPVDIPGVSAAIEGALDTAFDKIIKPIVNPLNQMAQQVIQPCVSGTPSTPGDLGNHSCICVQATLPSLAALSPLCNGVSANEQAACNSCLNNGGIWTAATCVDATVQSFIEKTLLGWGIGLAGTIALLCIIYAAFRIQTSRGNPEGIKKAQELLTSCIMGLMLIIFSVFILRLIGVNILQIPGFK